MDRRWTGGGAALSKMHTALRNISDVYFYEELLRYVGPKEAIIWLQESLNCQVRKQGILNQFRLSLGSSSRSSISIESSESMQSPQEEKHEISNPSNNSHQRSFDLETTKLPDQTWTTASDIELTAESSENIGILFTDAAHLILHDKDFCARMRRRKSSFF